MYTVPRLFLVMAFQEEVDILFPKRDAKFQHLARYVYMFHPANHAQFDPWTQQLLVILQQIMSCLWEETLLLEVLATRHRRGRHLPVHFL